MRQYLVFHPVKNFHQFGFGVGPEHCYAGFSEVRDAFEEGRGGKVTAYMENSAVFVDTVDAFIDLTAQNIELFSCGNRFISGA